MTSQLARRVESSGSVYQQRFAVEYNYPVFFTSALFDTSNDVFVDAVLGDDRDNLPRRVSILIDEGLLGSNLSLVEDIRQYVSHHRRVIKLACDPTPIAGGEEVKNSLEIVVELQQLLVDQQMDRHSVVVAIGGGAVLDLVGFVAATTHRGIRHVRVPTTVLAQNDSGVGVKNGVNAFGLKNLLGSFAPPFAVINDAALLDSLGARDKIAGMAEAVKVALIRDAEFFSWLESKAEALAAFDTAAMAWLIRRCAELHMHQIAHGGDPFERGSARPLDYGHWAAHRLEALTHHGLRHGEAVAIGIALDSRYAVQIGMLAPGSDERIASLLETLGFDLWHDALLLRDESGEYLVLRGLQEFREHLGGELTITLLEDIGVGVEVHEMDDGQIRSAITWLQDRGRKSGGIAAGEPS